MSDPVAVLKAGVELGAFPGGQLAASREGERLASACAGHLGPGLAKTSRDAIYDLASLTKALATTVLIGRALERSRCNLLDPISRFVPGADPQVQLEHLLEHSSGYPAHVRFDQRLSHRVVPGSWDAWRAVVLDAARTPREAPPGRRAVYSDVGFILLGAALEVILGRPLSVSFAELGTGLFFRDLRGPPVPPVRPPRAPIAPTEGKLTGVVHDENCRAMGGAAGHAGLWGTAEQVLAVAESLVRAYHGARKELLAPETVRRIWTPSLVGGSTRTLGWDRPSPTGSSTGGRWPAHSVGHLGFTGTSVWIEPERALIVVLVTNRVCPTRHNEGIRRVRTALHDAAWKAWAQPRVAAKAQTPIRTLDSGTDEPPTEDGFVPVELSEDGTDPGVPVADEPTGRVTLLEPGG